MSTNHGSVATHAHSLPPFAQAFSTHSLSNISTANNALPPIQSRIPDDSHRVDSPARPPRSRPSSDDSDHRQTARKRTHHDIASSSRDDDPHDDQRASPRLQHIKQEQDHDMLEHSPPPSDHPTDHRMPLDDPTVPQSPGCTASPMKKRRVTVSGAPHPLNTDITPVADQTNSTPISPVVMGFTINRDNPTAMEQVRSMLSVKQKQKALIEQRRGSLVGAPSSNTNPPPPPLSEERISAPTSKSAIPPRPSRRSPNTNTSNRRVVPTGSTRPPSPSSMLAPAQHQPHPAAPPAPVSTQTLPFPPISFARRRAGLLGGAGKRKPADILISPREAQSSDQLQPSIQSAPPIPHAGQGAFQAARLPMALPRLPSVMSATDNVRRVASNVPPTPTRLALHRPPATPMRSVSGRSPPAPSVPIASTLVPPTPASLHHPGYSGDRSAFLAPFEIFYDALNDSKQLKSWLGEQLQRSNALVQSLTQQQEKLNETVESAVEKRVSGMRAEMVVLRRRVEDLEDALRNATSGRRPSTDMTGGAGLAKGKQPLRNGSNPAPPETYTFPPPSHELPRHRPDTIRRPPSPSWSQERDVRGHPLPPPPHSGDSERHASPPYDSRRLATVSASRLDPPRSRDTESSSSHYSRPGINVPSPPQAYRDHPSTQNLPPIRDSHGRPMRSERERPGLTRQHSHAEGNASPNPLPPPTPSSSSSHSAQQQSSRRPGSPRNSIVMSPPDVPGSESS